LPRWRGIRSEQRVEIGVIEPQVAQRPHGQIVAQCTRQHGAIDAASRSAGDDIDNDPQFEYLSNILEQFEIDFVAVIFRIIAGKPVKTFRRRSLRAVHDGMEGGRCANQLENLPADSVHVDCKRNAPETDKRYAELFLFQGDRSFRAR
jgi:hypothetical protein